MHATVVVPRLDPVSLCERCLGEWKRMVNAKITAALLEFLGAANTITNTTTEKGP
jgi:hypothetical protein